MLERQVRRMLADRRSQALVNNFASQWLYLRNLESARPDSRLFPDFDDNLRQAFRRETEMLFESVVNEDRSVLDLVARRLHVRESASSEALRDSQRIWQPFPARRARKGSCARRSAGTGQHPHGDIVRQSHVSGESRQMDSRESARDAGAASTAERTAARGKRARARRYSPCASGWSSIAPILYARAVIN